MEGNLAEQIKTDLDRANPGWASIPDAYRHANVITKEAQWLGDAKRPAVRISDFTAEDRLTGISVATDASLCEMWAQDKIAQAKVKGKGFVYSQIDADLLKKLNDALTRSHGDAQIVASVAAVAQAVDASKLGEDVEAYVFRKDSAGDEFEVWVFGVDRQDAEMITQNLTGVRQISYLPTDEAAQKKGYTKNLVLGCSAGVYTSFENDGGIGDPDIEVQTAYIRSKERADEEKARKSIERLFAEMRNKLFADVDVAVEEFANLYESERVSDSVLENINRFVAVMSWAEGQGIVEMDRIRNYLGGSTDAAGMFALLDKKFTEIFGEPTRDLINRKTYKPTGYFNDRLTQAVGSDWAAVKKILPPDGSMNHLAPDRKTLLPGYTRETRSQIVNKISDTIRQGGVVVVGSMDWDKLKDANEISIIFGNFMIRMGAANASKSIQKAFANCEQPPYVTLLKRDRAGDETVMVACLPWSEKERTIDVEREFSALNGWKKSVSLVTDSGQEITYPMSMSAGLATSLDFEGPFNETRDWLTENKDRVAFEFFEKLFAEADAACKTVKAVKQLDDLPLDDLVSKMGVSDSIRRTTQVFGGGRLSKESLEFLLKITRVKAYRGEKDIGTMVDHVFKQINLPKEPLPIRASKLYMQSIGDHVSRLFKEARTTPVDKK